MIAAPLFTMPMTFRLRGLNHWSALLEARSIWLLALPNNTPVIDNVILKMNRRLLVPKAIRLQAASFQRVTSCF